MWQKSISYFFAHFYEQGCQWRPACYNLGICRCKYEQEIEYCYGFQISNKSPPRIFTFFLLAARGDSSNKFGVTSDYLMHMNWIWKVLLVLGLVPARLPAHDPKIYQQRWMTERLPRNLRQTHTQRSGGWFVKKLMLTKKQQQQQQWGTSIVYGWWLPLLSWPELRNDSPSHKKISSQKHYFIKKLWG